MSDCVACRPSQQDTAIDYATEPLLFAALVLVMAFAGLVHGTLGLGFPLVATPIVAALIDVRSAILLTLAPTVAVNLASIIGAKGYSKAMTRYWPLAACGLAGGVLGTYVLTISDPAPFKLLLAVLITVFLWASVSQRIPREAIRRYGLGAMIAFGLVAGFAAGTTNVMVAVLIIYFLAIDIPRTEMVPVMNTCFMLGKLAQIGVLLAAGLLTLPLVADTAPLALVAILALRLGQRLRDKVPVESYKRLLHGLLAALAAILVYQYAST